MSTRKKHKKLAGFSILAIFGIIAAMLLPASMASATGGGSNNGKDQQVFCNQEGNSGKWKAQIGGPSTEHEYPLKDADGNNVFVHDQSEVTSSMDAACQDQYGTPTPTKTEVTAVDGMFIDLCGTDYNLKFRSAVTEGIAYLQTRDGNTLTVRAVVTDSTKYVLTNPDWTQSATDTLTPCEEPQPEKIANPTITLEPKCDINNDGVVVSHSADYTAGKPVWHDSIVSVTFTINDGVNKVFQNGEKSITIEKIELDVSDCPVQPPTPTKTEVTAVNGSFDDKCGYVYNLTYTPAVTEGVRYVQTREGNTLTVRAEVTDSTKYELTNPDWSDSRTDLLVPCGTPPPSSKEFTVTYGEQKCVPAFGPNGTFNDEVTSPVVTPTEAASVASSVNGATLTQSVTPNEGYVPKEGAALEKTFTDHGGDCGAPPLPPRTLKSFDLTVTCGKLTGVYPKSNPAGVLMYGSRDLPEPDNTPEVIKPGQTITIKTSRSVLDIMIFVDGYEPLVWNGIKVPQNCTVKPPHHKPPVTHPHHPPVVVQPVTHHTPAPWTPPTKQRTSGGNTGVDTVVVVSQASASSLGTPIGLAGVALLAMLGSGVAIWRRFAYKGRHAASAKA